MGDQASKDDVAKQRIISHMNADHQDSIIRFLQHYIGLPSYRAYYGKMEDITLDRISLSVAGKERHDIELKPAMTSYREARERVVQMDKTALTALGKSDITVKAYVRPSDFQLVLLLLFMGTVIGSSNRVWFRPGSTVASISPATARLFHAIQPTLLVAVLLINAAETTYMIRGRLWKHSVNVCTRLWWHWVIGTFIASSFSLQSFDELVKSERVKKEKKQE